MLTNLLYLLAAIAILLGFLALVGVLHMGGIGWVGLFVTGAILALVAYFFSGGFGRGTGSGRAF
jgi:hypothetical protein